LKEIFHFELNNIYGVKNLELSINSKVKLNNGVHMPRLGFGTWKLKGDKALSPVKWALDTGYRSIDTATLYGNEKSVGKAIQESDVPRKEIFITTKVWDSDLGYEKTQKAFQRSLNNLNIEYIDLYLIHWPRKLRNESWKAMEELYKQGKIKAIGVANFAISHLQELLDKFEIVPAVNQFELHPFLYSERKDLIEFCRRNNIQVEAYSPLTHGKQLNNPTLKTIAKEYDKTTAQLLIRWSLQHDFVVIPKSGDKNHIQENSDVFDFHISENDMGKIDSVKEEFRLLYDTSTWD
jgi:diketogulonate reductase-like aldo/keto reductase